MWFKLNTTFTQSLGTLSELSNSWSITRNLTNFSTNSTVTSVTKNDSYSATFTLNDECTYSSHSVTMGGATVTSGVTLSSDKKTLTVSISKVTGAIVITAVATGASSGGSGGDTTNYTYTINPTPTSATVTLSATGYSTVSGTGSKSITVANGTKVNWTVSADGYITRTGNWTISSGNKIENITLVASDGSDGQIATYLLNKNIWSDGEITDQSGAGRVAVLTYFPTNGKELQVSSTVPTTTIAKRYYDADKQGGANAATSTYGRVVLVVQSGSLTSDVCNGQTITVNGVVYALQLDPSANGGVLKYQVGVNIGADGLIDSSPSYADRFCILDFIETNGAALNVMYNNANYQPGSTSVNSAKRYYLEDKTTMATSAADSVYGRIVFYGGTDETCTTENIEGTLIVINNVSYILSNA